MTSEEQSPETYSPPTAQDQDQEVTLLDQIRWVTFGHQVDDVLTVAVALLMQCVIQKTRNKEAALKYLDAVYVYSAEQIETDYDAMRLEGVLSGQPT